MSPPRRRIGIAGVIVVVVVASILLVVVGVVLMMHFFGNHEFNDPPIVLHDIAWDVNPKHGYTVYILEAGEYVPYLVLTTDYNGDGHVLLLRKYLLDEMMIFNYLDDEIPKDLTWSIDFLPSYYRTSKIDTFLNGEFLDRLSSIEGIIVTSNIVVTHIYSIGRTGRRSQTIERKVFLLSLMEVVGIENRISVVEGRHLEYFRVRWQIFGDRRQDAMNLRIATTVDGEHHFWWLRTSMNAGANIIYAITSRGGLGGGDVGSQMLGHPQRGVRPAFCLPRDVPIKEVEMDGRMVFVLDLG